MYVLAIKMAVEPRHLIQIDLSDSHDYSHVLVNFQSNIIDANVQLYTTSNNVMSIQDCLHMN